MPVILAPPPLRAHRARAVSGFGGEGAGIPPKGEGGWRRKGVEIGPGMSLSQDEAMAALGGGEAAEGEEGDAPGGDESPPAPHPAAPGQHRALLAVRALRAALPTAIFVALVARPATALAHRKPAVAHSPPLAAASIPAFADSCTDIEQEDISGAMVAGQEHRDEIRRRQKRDKAAVKLLTKRDNKRRRRDAKEVHLVYKQILHVRSELAYRAQQVLGLNALLKLIVLIALTVPIVVLGAQVYRMVGQHATRSGTMKNAMYFAYALMNDIPGTDLHQEDSFAGLLVSNLIYSFGMVTFAVFLGVVCDEIQDMVHEVKTGNQRVVESDHTVVLNWNDQGIQLLKQMAIAKEEGRKLYKKPVVILSSDDKDDLDRAISDALEGSRLKVVTRHGQPFALADLDRAAAHSAKTIIVLHGEGSGGSDDPGFSEEIKKASAIVALNKGKEGQTVLVQMKGPLPPEEDIVRKSIIEAKLVDAARGLVGNKARDFVRLHSSDRVGDIFAWSALQPGLSRALNDIMIQDKGGVEIYSTPAARSTVGRSYNEIWRRYASAVLLGIVRPAEGGGAGGLDAARQERYDVMMVPSPDEVVREGDFLVFLADGDKDCRLSWIRKSLGLKVFGDPPERPINAARPGETAADVAARVGVPSEALLAANPGVHPQRLVDGQVLRVPSAEGFACKDPQKILVAGWNDIAGPHMCRLLAQRANYGTVVTILSPACPESLPPDNAFVKFKWTKGAATSTRDLQRAGAGWECDTAIILQPTTLNHKERDANTMGTLLHLQDIWRDAKMSPHVVAAVYEPHTVDLLKNLDAGKRGHLDLVLEDELTSGAMVQLSANPELTGVVRDLVEMVGTEIRVHKASEYVDVRSGRPVAFSDVSELAHARGEVALGYFCLLDQNDLHLSPDKKSHHVYRPGDRIVVMEGKTSGR